MWEKMQAVQAEDEEMTYTENGARTHRSSGSRCLDLFAAIGAMRHLQPGRIIDRFVDAFREDPDMAMKILFYARDVRGGLGERRVFRVLLRYLAGRAPESVAKNVRAVPEYGRWDDLLSLLGTSCEGAVIDVIREQLADDLIAIDREDEISLLAKWLPSVNASCEKTRRAGKRIARALGMNDAEYRRTLSRARAYIRVIENSLRERDYTFDYSKQPSRAMYKYRRAFIRNDGERYRAFITSVSRGEATLHTGGLAPYDIIAPLISCPALSDDERASIDAAWRALEDFTNGEDALAVIDGSGSMYRATLPSPITVAMSLGIYFAERNRGVFHGKFITFSERPKLVELKDGDIYDRVRDCMNYGEVANTDLQRVFDLVLETAVRYEVPQSELPTTLFIISDMEFDACATNAGETNFERARRRFAEHGYSLPRVVFWNVASRNVQQPVRENEQGVALVSSCTPRLFSMVASGAISPYDCMMEILSGERYRGIAA